MDVLLSLNNEYAYFREQGPKRIADLGHDPWFWAIPKKGQDAGAALRRVRSAWEQAAANRSFQDDGSPLQKIKSIGELEPVRSFVNPGESRPAFKVAAKRSFFVPEISDELFYAHDVFTAEHDVPYQQRACVDLAAQDKAWAFDTKGQKTKLKVLVYDIETTQYGQRKKPPIDIIGFSDFEITYEASKDLDKEEFHFNLLDQPRPWQECDITQLTSRNPDEEITNLLKFVRKIPEYQIVSGHNILSFDNKEVFDRIRHYLEIGEKDRNLTTSERRAFEQFAGRPGENMGQWASRDRTFTFGQQSETVNFYPTSFDTYHATRRFYFFLDDFTLKKVAPFLGVVIPNRVYLSPNDLKLDDAKTLDYNKHDCQEQLGITMLLLAQALPLAFTSGWTFEEVLTGGNVRIWDHMAMIRAARQKKLMPATCRAQGIARTVLNNLGTRPNKLMIADDARSRMRGETQSWLKEYVRVAKYGDEMPDWLELPHVIVNQKTVQDPGGNGLAADGEAEEDEEEQSAQGYAIPGGMTIHPQDVGSHFVPWWYVVDADVGAMYPTILRARNVGPDTVRLARRGETVDSWVWLYKVPEDFAKDERFQFRPVGPEENFAKPGEGIMVGVKIDKTPGLVPLAMKAIMGIATKTKRALGAAKKSGTVSKTEIERLTMTYASIKAMRNAGTHGQMLAVNVSCRGFNLWAGAEITTIGQKILADSLVELKQRQARVVYGDSLTGDRCVVVKDPRGRIDVRPIEELFTLVRGEPHYWHGKDAVFGNDWQALTRTDSGSGWAPIKRVIRHATDKQVYRVSQVTGETTCTEDHSVMVLDDGKAVETRPTEVDGRPFIRVPCPANETSGTVDLWEEIGAFVQQLEQEPVFDGRSEKQLYAGSFSATESEIRFYTGATLRRHVDLGSEQASALARLLGAYVSEGSVTWGKRRGASIANSDRQWLEGIQRDYFTWFGGMEASIIQSDRSGGRTIVLADGTPSTYVDGTLKLQMTNVLPTVVFWALSGNGSHRKNVPSFVFNAPRRVKEEFLRVLVEGDGSHAWGPRYTPAHNVRHFKYETKSLQLASGLCVLLDQLGMDYGVRSRPSKKTYVVWTRDSAKPLRRSTCEPVHHVGYVYDLEVEGTHTFVDAFGSILTHNTDGIYIGCSKSGRNLMSVAGALGDEQAPAEDTWYIHPDKAIEAINDLNRKWRDYLGYEDFELEAGHHDAMLFVVHKNYLIFDVKNGKLKMQTKGNNFKGSDKAPLAQKALEQIMVNALKDNIEWSDEEKARESMKAAIKRWTQEAVKALDPTKFERDDLTLIQVVQPKNSYKVNSTGTSSWIKRAEALEKLTGEKLKAPKKYRFVVCKKPLPGIEKPTKAGMKPLDYMWPLDSLKDPANEIDLAWYKDMVQKYVRGAFGFEDLELHAQKGLDAWM